MGDTRSGRIGHRPLPWIILAVGLLGSIAGWRALADLDRRAVAARFERDADERADAIAWALHHAADRLVALAAFLAASGRRDEAAFHAFAQPTLEHEGFPSAASWNPVVTEAGRAAFEAGGGAAGPPTPLTERAPDGTLVPAGRRPRHVVVQLIVPLEPNRAAVGYDVYSEPRRRAALDRAAASDRPEVTAPLELVQLPPPGRGVLAFLAVRRPGAAPTGWDGVDGFAVSVLPASELVQAGPAGAGHHGIEARIEDRDAEEGNRLLHETPGFEEARERGTRDGLVHRREIAWGGRRWEVTLAPNPGWRAAQRSSAAPVGLAGGLLLTLVLAGLVASLQARAARVEAQVEERRREEASLREHQERLRQIMDAVSDGAWEWNVQTGEVDVTDRWLATRGFRREEVAVDLAFWEGLIHPADRERVLEALDRHLRGETEVYECEYRIRHGDGTYRWDRDRGRVVARDAAGAPLRMVGADHDIDEERRARDEREAFEERMRETQRLESLGLLAGGIAHDFNNLLGGVLGGVEHALEQLPVGSPARADLELAALAARRGAELTREMLAYSGRGAFVTEPLSLPALAGEVTRLLEASVSKLATVRLELPTDLPAVIGDPAQLRQVLMNLVMNAVEALEDRPGTVTLRAACVARSAVDPDGLVLPLPAAPPRFVALAVSDSGVGMDPSTRERVFEPFFTTKFQGRGLGLAAALGIVKGHGGTLRVVSAPGEGTTFTVYLPAAEGAAVPAPAPASSPRPVPETDARRGEVLVVEDEDIVRDMLRRVLARRGYTVRTAADGHEGLAVFEAHRDALDALVLDLTMPGIGGREVLARVREARPDLPVVLVSGWSAEETSPLVGDDPRTAFLGKPFSPPELLAALERLAGAGR